MRTESTATRNLEAVRRALGAMLIANGHFISTFEINETSGGPRDFVVSYQHGGHYLITLRPIPDSEVAAIIMGGAEDDDYAGVVTRENGE